MVVCCEHHVTLMNAGCGQNAWICNVMRVVNREPDWSLYYRWNACCHSVQNLLSCLMWEVWRLLFT